ncbi:hypothetical protein, partial [Mycobacterium simiae]|uniref:hypothetical protein n=1 Tax=Mycobacterium simiae TaxID=1784 RepID=UPI001E6199AA
MLTVNDNGVVGISLNAQNHQLIVGNTRARTRVRVRIVEHDHDVRVVTVFDSEGKQINQPVTIDLNSDIRSHTTGPTRDRSNRELTVNPQGVISVSLNGIGHQVGLGIDHAGTRVRVRIDNHDHGVRVVTVFDSKGKQINESVTIDPKSGKTSHSTRPRGGGPVGDGRGGAVGEGSDVV